MPVGVKKATDPDDLDKICHDINSWTMENFVINAILL